MPKIVETRTITTIGVGRPDYSQDIETSVAPLVRSHQWRITWTSKFKDLYYPTGDWMAIGGIINPNWVGQILNVYNIRIEFGVNILFESYFAYMDWRDWSIIAGPYAHQYGYGKIEINFPKGVPIEIPHPYLLVLVPTQHFSSEHNYLDFTCHITGIRDEWV